MTKYVVLKNVKYGVHVVDPSTRQGRIGKIYAQSQHDLLTVPELLTVHSASVDVLAGIWGVVRETLVAGRVARSTKEMVATVVSQINQCPWCVDAHSIGLYAANQGNVVKAIIKHNPALVVDQHTRDLLDWAYASLTPGADRLHRPPFSPEDAPEILGTAFTFQYLTRIVSALLVATPLPGPNWLHKPFQRIMGVVMAQLSKQRIEPGLSLVFLPDAPLPADFIWAELSPAVSGAIARFVNIIEQIEQRTVPPPVRALVYENLAAWNGENPPMSRYWIEQATSHLQASDKTIAELALLAARAPYQIDERIITAFRHEQETDEMLIEILAWSAFVAARRINCWISPQVGSHTTLKRN